MGGYLCCSRTSAMPSSPSEKGISRGILDNVVNGLPTIPTAAYLAAESISPTTGPGREGTKMLRLEHARKNMVCAMKCGVAPSQPTYEHHSITALHQFLRVPNATLLHWGRRLPLQLAAVGNKSLMWSYHITRTSGCSIPPRSRPEECQHPLTKCSLHPQRK